MSKYPYIKRFLTTYLHGKFKFYAIGIICLVVTIVLMTIAPLFIKDGLDFLLDYSKLTSLEMLYLKSSVRNIGLLLILGGGILCMTRALSRIFIFIPGRQIENTLRQDFFRAASSLSLFDIKKFNIGDLISRGTNDITNVRHMISMGILHIINSLLMIFLCIYFMFGISVKMTFICLIPFIFLIFGTNIIARRMMYYSRLAQKQLGCLSESTRELLSSYNLFTIFDVFSFIRRDFDKQNNEYFHYSDQLGRARIYILGMTILIINLSIFILIYYGGKLVIDKNLTVGEFVSFSLYLNILIQPLRAIGWLMSTFHRGEVSLTRIFSVIDLQKQYVNKQSLRKIKSEDEFKQNYSKKESLISMKNIIFRYQKNNKDDFCLEIKELKIEKGKKYGIYGKTGSGKSTFAKILAAKIDVNEGELALGGLNYNQISQKVLKSQFAFVFQENLHFIGSIDDNLQNIIDGGVEMSYKNSISITDAYEISQLAFDRDNFPNKGDTILGEFGLNLSGGQKQRLALSRALVYPSQILFLDDFVSSLDHKTERIIIQNIFEKINHTIVLISHRISTLEKCDEIWLMSDGKIIKKATHQELLKQDKEYAATYRYQQIENLLGMN